MDLYCVNIHPVKLTMMWQMCYNCNKYVTQHIMHNNLSTMHNYFLEICMYICKVMILVETAKATHAINK